MEIAYVTPSDAINILNTIIQAHTSIVTITATFVTFSFIYFSKNLKLPSGKTELTNVFRLEQRIPLVTYLLFFVPVIFLGFSYTFHRIDEGSLKYLMLLLYAITSISALLFVYSLVSTRIYLEAEKQKSLKSRIMFRLGYSYLFGINLSVGLYLIVDGLGIYNLSKPVPNTLIIACVLFLFALSFVGRVTSFFLNRKIELGTFQKINSLWSIFSFSMTLGLIIPLIDTILKSYQFINSSELPAGLKVNSLSAYAYNDYYIFLAYILSIGTYALIYNQLIQNILNEET